jgi:carboxypeptidase family protein
MRLGSFLVGLLVPMLVAASLHAQVAVSGRVLDENGVAVAAVRVELDSTSSPLRAQAVSDAGGSFALELEKPGEYRIRAERQGFFLFSGKSAEFHPGSNQLVITLNYVQEFAETIDVTYSPPAIDPQEPADKKQLDNMEILTVPYPAPQDLRSSLPLMNGVVQDVSGRLHFNGGATEQTSFLLDGFNIADPVTGRLEARLNIDSVRSLDLDSSRFAAEKGGGSAGGLDIRTKMGDDRWRFGATNFVPGLSAESGWHVDKWSPRLEFSGPLVRGRVWFHNGLDFFYSDDVVHGLPSGQNRAGGLTVNDLGRFQVNLTPANILTGSLLLNHADNSHYGLSFLNPIETTTRRQQDLYMYTLKDQMYVHGGTLVELGFADTRGLLQQVPRGSSIFEISPFGQRGNYFVNLDRHTRRQEWLANVYAPAVEARGSHQLKFGLDVDSNGFHQGVERHDYRVLRVDRSVARYVTFAGGPFQSRRNFEAAQYVQDRWAPRDGLLIEAGMRAEWNEVVRDVLWSPRLAFAWAPKRLHETKIAGGYGVFYDALMLGIIAQGQDQVSYSTFFLPGGMIQRGPVMTEFLVNQQQLRAPRYRTLSFSVERKLPLELYGKAAYLRREGSQGLMFVNDLQVAEGGIPAGGLYRLHNGRHDRYDALELSLRRTFAGRFEWSMGYTRSSARANAVVDYNMENPIFAPQAPGPYSWNAPNRFLTWGWAPLPERMLPRALRFLTHETSAAYLGEYRTGFPFGVVNEEGVQVGAPNSRRFPSYFNINLHFERKFRFFHYLWAWRVGLNNLTNCGNPNVVNNNIDSPNYLTYGRGQVRAVAVRLRFLGKR